MHVANQNTRKYEKLYPPDEPHSMKLFFLSYASGSQESKMVRLTNLLNNNY